MKDSDMVYKSTHDAKKEFRAYKPLAVDVPWFLESSHKLKFGDWILFQDIIDWGYPAKAIISRPILGLFLEWTVWDQALVMNYAENKRAYTYCREVMTNPEYNIKMPMSCIDMEVDNVVFWHDNLNMLGYWGQRPSISQLKEALNKQIS